MCDAAGERVVAEEGVGGRRRGTRPEHGAWTYPPLIMPLLLPMLLLLLPMLLLLLLVLLLLIMLLQPMMLLLILMPCNYMVKFPKKLNFS